MEWTSRDFWERFRQIVGLLICMAAVWTEIMGWSTDVPRRMREAA